MVPPLGSIVSIGWPSRSKTTVVVWPLGSVTLPSKGDDGSEPLCRLGQQAVALRRVDRRGRCAVEERLAGELAEAL